MNNILTTIVILQVIIIISLLASLLGVKQYSYSNTQPQEIYIPNISEVVGSGKRYDVSGSWMSSDTGTNLLIAKIDDNDDDKFNIALIKQGSTTPDQLLTATMDHYNGVLNVSSPVDVDDPAYTSTPVMVLLVDPNMEDKLLDPYTAKVYNKVPANPASGNIISHLSGIWKDNNSADLLDIKVTDYLIEGTLAENKIIGIFNPDNMKFVVFIKGFPVPGYYENNTFTVLFMGMIYEFKKIVEYKP
jgi:hypothetical protein